MIKRVRIRGYKSLRDMELELQPFAVLFGPNASGKSNFLDALQLLSRMATSRTLRQGFESPYRGKPLESFSFDQDGISGLLNKPSASFSIEVDVELSETVISVVEQQIRELKRGIHQNGDHDKGTSIRENLLRYRIEVEILPQSGILRVVDEYLAPLNKDGEVKKSRSPFLDRVDNRLVLRREGQSHPTYFERYLDHSILSLPHYPPHYPHLTAMAQELSSWSFFYFEPRERMRAPNPVKEVRHMGLMGEELSSFLNTMRVLDEKQFHAIEKALRVVIPSITDINVTINSVGEAELSLIESGIPIPARVLSEGTLRVLGLLSLSGVKNPPSLIGFEEPENGIHPRRIKLVGQLLQSMVRNQNTQIIVTTHSPTLLDVIPPESLYACRKIDGQTEIKAFTSTDELWQTHEINHALNDDESDDGPILTVSERLLRGDFDA